MALLVKAERVPSAGRAALRCSSPHRPHPARSLRACSGSAAVRLINGHRCYRNPSPDKSPHAQGGFTWLVSGCICMVSETSPMGEYLLSLRQTRPSPVVRGSV